MALTFVDSVFSTTEMPLTVTSRSFNESNVTISIVNEVEDDKPPYSIFEMILIAIVAGMLSIVTVIGNIMVMISFKMDKQLQTISNYFLLSLAVADFSIGLISMPLFTMYLLIGKWPLGDFVCDTWLAFDYLNSNASVLNLLIISFDRYFSVTRPLTYRALRTTRRAAFMIASAWVISLMLWPPWIYAWPYIEGERTVKKNQCYIQFLETNSYVTFGTALAAFYVPVTVMCFLYWRIWRETKQRQKDLTHLQAGKKEDSRKSTSSDDPPEPEEIRKPEETRRFRADSCILEDDHETTYVPTSLCVETSKYLPKHKESKRLKITELLRAWCRIDREGDPQEDESTSHESPATTPASLETPMQSCSRTASMSFRIDHRIPLQTQSHPVPSTSQKTNDQAIPMTERNGQRRFEQNVPEWKRQQVTSMTPRPVSAPVVPLTIPAAISSTSTLSLRPRQPVPLPVTSQSPIYTPDSVYTILIRLPPKSTSIEGEGESQASIKMIMEDEEISTDAIETIQEGESVDNKNSLEAGTADSLLRAADSAVDAIRLPLNTKLVHKQVAKHRAPKKKRKQQERKQEMKAAKTLSAILFAFTVTWTPYNVLVLYKTLSNCEDDDCITPGLWYFAYYLCYINSTVNPFCYALCNANFRRTYTRILSCKWHNKKKTLDSRGFFT